MSVTSIDTEERAYRRGYHHALFVACEYLARGGTAEGLGRFQDDVQEWRNNSERLEPPAPPKVEETATVEATADVAP